MAAAVATPVPPEAGDGRVLEERGTRSIWDRGVSGRVHRRWNNFTAEIDRLAGLVEVAKRSRDASSTRSWGSGFYGTEAGISSVAVHHVAVVWC